MASNANPLPVPPRPQQLYDDLPPPPPVPPLPPNYQPERPPDPYVSPPHLEDPLVAPRPQKITPDLPADMARTLDHSLAFAAPDHHRLPTPAPPPPPQQHPGLNNNPGFAFPTPAHAASSPPPPPPSQPADAWSPWNIPQHNHHRPYPQSPPSLGQSLPPQHPQQPYAPPARPMSGYDPLASSMSGLAIATTPPPPLQRTQNDGPPSLTAPLPTVASLTAALPAIQNPAGDPASKLAWARDVLSLVDRLDASARSTSAASEPPPPGPVNITDQGLARLSQVAVPLVAQLANPQPPPNPLPLYVAEAIYHRANLAASGAFPQFLPHNPRSAFRDYERAARAGFHAGWFKLGRDYETFGDAPHAKDCFERGIKYGNESSLYRMGMANLMGQLGLPPNPEAAIPLLQRAATVATVDIPQPAYVFGLLLLAEFSHVTVPPHLFTPFIPAGSTREGEARRHLERAAYLNFAPAQYKLGHAYEFAQPPFPFDPLLSVQYYSLASQQGEIEADMALSKWFLCGAEGSFDKDESLAFTFAEKAARRGLPSAEFAMGYYMEVGVGGPKDIAAATKWYTRAAQHGNADATERLAALAQPAAHALSRQEHDTLTESTLVRKRTQAKQRSDARPRPAPGAGGQNPNPNPNMPPQTSSAQIVEHIRKNSLAQRPPPGSGPGPAQGGPSPYAGPPPPRQGSGDAYGPPPPQNQSPPRAHPGAPRYGLTDPGVGPGPGPGRTSPAGAGPGGRPSHGRVASSSAVPQAQQQQQQQGGGSPTPASRPPPAKGPATFQEMGFQSQKLEDKECVIM